MLTSNLFGTCRGIQNERCKERLCVLRYGMQFHDLAYSKNSALLAITQRVVVISYTTTRCVITQKSAVLSCFAAEG